MKIHHAHWLSLLILTPATSFAIFCPTNFNQINAGDSIDQVQKQCGKATFEETKEVTPPTPQEFNYYTTHSVPVSNVKSPGQGTLKTSIAFDAAGKVINISVNGIGIGASTICGPNIKLGDSIDTVKAACGDPSFITSQQSPNGDPATKDKVTTLTYKANPPVVLKFVNGKFTPGK